MLSWQDIEEGRELARRKYYEIVKTMVALWAPVMCGKGKIEACVRAITSAHVYEKEDSF